MDEKSKLFCLISIFFFRGILISDSIIGEDTNIEETSSK